MRQKLLLLGAVFFGFLAFALSYLQLQAEKQKIQGGAESVFLIKVTRNIAAGEELRESDIARTEEQRLKGNSFTNREIPWSQSASVVGRKLESSMVAGQLLLNSDLRPLSQRQGFNAVIREGMRAVSVPVDSVAAVSNLVLPNDNVDVIGTFRFPDMRGDSALDTVTLTILQNVKVLAVGNRWGGYAGTSGGRANYSTVTLLLYPEEVEMVVFASQKGRLSLSLRNFDDSRIDRNIEKRSVNFRQLEKDIPSYNDRRGRKQQGF